MIVDFNLLHRVPSLQSGAKDGVDVVDGLGNTFS
jgi:hypothetical protein